MTKTNAMPIRLETQTTRTLPSHLASIDGLRGLACLMVLFGHCQMWFHEPSFDRWHLGSVTLSPSQIFSMGGHGVDLFFVLSGFCLAYPIVSRSGRNIDWRRYAAHRLRRILPPYWAALLFFAAMSIAITRFHIDPFWKTDVIPLPSARQFAYSLTLISVSLNRSFWTLPIEWRWYFLLPLLVVLWRRVRGGGVLIVSAAVSLLYLFGFVRLHAEKADFLLTALPAYLPLFAFGIWAAELTVRAQTGGEKALLTHYAAWGVGLGVLLVAFVHLPGGDGASRHPWENHQAGFRPWEYVQRVWTWGPLCFFTILTATRPSRLQRFLSLRPLVSLGLFSYSLYLTHEPLIRCAALVIMPQHWPDAVQFGFHQVVLTARFDRLWLFVLSRRRKTVPAEAKTGVVSGDRSTPGAEGSRVPMTRERFRNMLTHSPNAPFETEPQPVRAASPHLASIDGLRGVACLMVLSFHCWLQAGQYLWPSVRVHGRECSLSSLSAFGYGGVDIFFVLSGFCLAYPSISRPEKTVDWKRYAVHRARRILPPYWGALLLFSLFSVLIRWNHVQPLADAGVLAWPGLRQYLYSVFLVSSSLNSAFWTLPVEWRWYFLLPLGLALRRRAGTPAVLLASVLICAMSAVLYPPFPFKRLAFLLSPLPTFLPYFALGIWAASLQIRQSSWEVRLVKAAPWGLCASGVLLAMLAPDYHVTAFSVTLKRLAGWTPFSFFLVVAATQNAGLQRRLSWKPLVAVGSFSYSLYLIHTPFIEAAYSVTGPLHWLAWQQFAFYQLLLLPLLIGFGYLFYLVAEKPWLRKPNSGQS